MLVRWLGGNSRGEALLRAIAAVAAVLLMLYLWIKIMLRFMLSPASGDYLAYARQRTSSETAYQLAAALPEFAAALFIGLVMGLAVALAFRHKPLGVVAAAGAFLLILFLGAVLSGGVAQAGSQLRIGLLGLVMLAGMWVMPRWRQYRLQRAAARQTAAVV